MTILKIVPYIILFIILGVMIYEDFIRIKPEPQSKTNKEDR